MDETIKSCQICTDEKVNSNFTFLPCSHELCTDCFNSWSKRSTECPFCRTSFCENNNPVNDNFDSMFFETVRIFLETMRRQRLPSFRENHISGTTQITTNRRIQIFDRQFLIPQRTFVIEHIIESDESTESVSDGSTESISEHFDDESSEVSQFDDEYSEMPQIDYDESSEEESSEEESYENLDNAISFYRSQGDIQNLYNTLEEKMSKDGLSFAEYDEFLTLSNRIQDDDMKIKVINENIIKYKEQGNINLLKEEYEKKIELTDLTYAENEEYYSLLN